MTSPQASPDAGQEQSLTAREEKLHQESIERPGRVAKLQMQVARLFVGESPAMTRVRDNISASLRVPQYGPHHQEGMYMDSHLALILENLDRIRGGQFPQEIPLSVRATLQATAMHHAETLERYTFLHDIAKKDCLMLKFGDGTSREITWEQWNAEVPDNAKEDPVVLDAYCREKGITGVSYFHKGENGKHGTKGKMFLEGIGYDGVPAAVLTAIDRHEVAYQFTAVNVDTYKKHLGSLSPEERDIALTASYIDTASSISENGKPNFTNFIALVESKSNFEQFQIVEVAVIADASLDQQKVQKALVDLRNMKVKFEESSENMIARIKQSCRPTQYDLSRLEAALQEKVQAGLLSAEEASAIKELVASQKASEIGKQFGRKMRDISPALKAAEMSN